MQVAVPFSLKKLGGKNKNRAEKRFDGGGVGANGERL